MEYPKLSDVEITKIAREKGCLEEEVINNQCLLINSKPIEFTDFEVRI